MEMQIGNRIADIHIIGKDGDYVQLNIDGQTFDVNIVKGENGSFSILHEGHSFMTKLIRHKDGKSYNVNLLHHSYDVKVIDNQAKYLKSKKNETEEQNNQIVAPMPGKVVKIPVKEGDSLAAGDTVIVIEAMKMQNNYKVSSDCTVSKILVNENDTVENNQVLITLEVTTGG